MMHQATLAYADSVILFLSRESFHWLVSKSYELDYLCALFCIFCITCIFCIFCVICIFCIFWAGVPVGIILCSNQILRSGRRPKSLSKNQNWLTSMIFKRLRSGLENIEYKVDSYDHPFEEHQHKLLIVDVAVPINISFCHHLLKDYAIQQRRKITLAPEITIPS